MDRPSPLLLEGGGVDGGVPMRAGVGVNQSAVRDRADGQRYTARCAGTTGPSAGAGSADPGETAYVSAGAAGVTTNLSLTPQPLWDFSAGRGAQETTFA